MKLFFSVVFAPLFHPVMKSYIQFTPYKTQPLNFNVLNTKFESRGGTPPQPFAIDLKK